MRGSTGRDIHDEADALRLVLGVEVGTIFLGGNSALVDRLEGFE